MSTRDCSFVGAQASDVTVPVTSVVKVWSDGRFVIDSRRPVYATTCA